MSQRILQFVQKFNFNDPAMAPVVIPSTGASTLVLPCLTFNVGQPSAYSCIEIASRYIFNAGAVNVYYNIGATCDTVSNFRAWLVPGQQLDCGDHGQVVNCCVAAGAVSGVIIPTQIIRRDLSQHGGQVPAAANA